MPELPEVETVRKSLIEKIVGRTINSVEVRYPKIIESDLNEFKSLSNKKIVDIKRIAKWLIFDLEDIYLLSHLRMEGKYFIKNKGSYLTSHDLIVFHLDNNEDLIYNDTRRFGVMALVEKDKLYDYPAIKKIGYEPFDKKLTKEYLFNKYKKISKNIKTTLLDQTIIGGLGNIYANEVLFASKIDPHRSAKDLSIDECQKIIDNSINILTQAIKDGGTTIRSYTSQLGVTGRFQQNLFVHSRQNLPCKCCGEKILVEQINGRSCYYCPKCQK